jgi:iron complex transport system ATP-binding protein
LSEAVLKICDVAYSYDSSQWRLGGVSLDVFGGDVIGIVGPNGSGKSTLVKIASGILQPTSGKVELAGEDIKTLPRRKIAAKLGYLPQDISSVFNYRVEEVVAMGRYTHLAGLGFMSGRDYEQINRCMELTETGQYRKRHLNQLSGGERQRVMLASVLAQEPEVLVLDEPTTGLDMHHQVGFFSLLKQLADKGMAVVVVTHDLNLAAMFCNKVMLLKGGEFVKLGSVEDVICSQVLGDIYPDNIYIGTHPVNGKPMVLPIMKNDGGAL